MFKLIKYIVPMEMAKPKNKQNEKKLDKINSFIINVCPEKEFTG